MPHASRACAVASAVVLSSLVTVAGAQPEPQPDPPAGQQPDEPKPPVKDPPEQAKRAPDEPPPPAPAPAGGPEARRGRLERERTFEELLSADLGPLRLWPIALVAVQAAPYAGGDSFLQAGDPAESEGFRLRRARLGVRGDVARRARFAVSAELGSRDDGTSRIHDAWISLEPIPQIGVAAGAQDVPYSRSALAGAQDQALVERPLAVRAMAPGHQIGVTAGGEAWDGALGYRVGLFNALQRSDLFYAGYVENYAALGNRYGGLAYGGRVTSEPFGDLGHTIDDVEGGGFRAGAGGGAFYSDGGARSIVGAGGDVLLKVAGVHVLGEILWSRTEPDSQPTQASAQLTEISSFAVVGEAGFTFTVVGRKLGVAARVERIDPNANVEDEGDAVAIAGGVSARILREIVRVQAEYVHREELSGLVLSNDAVVLQLGLRL